MDKIYIEKDGKVYEVEEKEVNLNEKIAELEGQLNVQNEAIAREDAVITQSEENISLYQAESANIQAKIDKIKADFPDKIDPKVSEVLAEEVIK